MNRKPQRFRGAAGQSLFGVCNVPLQNLPELAGMLVIQTQV